MNQSEEVEDVVRKMESSLEKSDVAKGGEYLEALAE